MLQGRYAMARLGHLRQIDIDKGHTRFDAAVGQNLSPWRNSQGMTMRAAPGAVAFGMKSGLGRGQHKAAGFNCAGAKQRFPMGGTRDVVERRRNAENLGTRLRKSPVEVGEPQVIADSQAKSRKTGISHYGRLTRPIALAFAVDFGF